jgi:acyl-CoA dehydrogenase
LSKIDAARGYPEALVDALTKAGWLAAMIAQEYGGSGLGLTEASVIMEEINRSGGRIKTVAVRKGDRYVVNGQKVWISRVQHSDLMMLLARTTPLAEVKKKSEGMSIFLVDLREAIGKGLTVRPIANMVNHETNELFFDNLEIPAAQTAHTAPPITA